jgi:hypothetical protein
MITKVVEEDCRKKGYNKLSSNETEELSFFTVPIRSSVTGTEKPFILKSTDASLVPVNVQRVTKSRIKVWHPCLYFVSVFALSHSLGSHLAATVESRKNRTDQ